MEHDDYPQSWTPPHIKEKQAAEDALMMGVDTYVAALSEDEFADMVARTRPGVGR